ncbi:hypothetical protein EKO04_009524 [Ascochyta lentis]|uniref:Uncharacterized protein n=1 Tax=Ascochyta lentis TaxID=205686 RepID=A0A8H7IX06_9PLEO|nr:hypothetical protein EKO04_009524 [Ascochyta lentis]
MDVPIGDPTFPAQIFPEEPVLHGLCELKSQTELTTAGDGDLNLTPTTSKEVQNLLRVIEAHHLTIDADLKSRLSHGLAETKIDNIISTEKTNKFGPKSWSRRAVLGKISSIEVQILKNNYALMERFHQIAASGAETAAQRTRRHSDEQAFRQASTQLDTQWTQSYHDYRNAAAHKKAEKEGTTEGEEWSRRYNLWEQLRTHPPQCQMDTSTFVTRADVLEAM